MTVKTIRHTISSNGVKTLGGTYELLQNIWRRTGGRTYELLEAALVIMPNYRIEDMMFERKL